MMGQCVREPCPLFFSRTLVGCCSGVDLLGLQGNKRHLPSPISHLLRTPSSPASGQLVGFICPCRQHAPRSHSHSCLQIKPDLSPFLSTVSASANLNPSSPRDRNKQGYSALSPSLKNRQTDNLPLPMRPNKWQCPSRHRRRATKLPSRDSCRLLHPPPESRHRPSRLARPPALHG